MLGAWDPKIETIRKHPKLMYFLKFGWRRRRKHQFDKRLMPVSRSRALMMPRPIPKRLTKRINVACRNACRWQAGKKTAASHLASEKTKPDLYASVKCMSWCMTWSFRVIFDIRKMVHECMSFLGEMKSTVKYMVLLNIIEPNAGSGRSYTARGGIRKCIRKLMHSCTSGCWH